MFKPLAQIIAIVALAAPGLALADTPKVPNIAKAECEHNVQDYDDLHCTYLEGLADFAQGKFIKHFSVNENFAYTTCVSGLEYEYDIYQEMAPDFADKPQVIEYSICTDPSGTQCELLGTDTFTIAADGEKDGLTHYSSQPRLFAIDVSAVADKYPTCNGLNRNPKTLVPFTVKRK